MSKPRTRNKKTRAATPQESAELRERLTALNKRANAGDPVAVAELGAFLDLHPEVWQSVGDLARLSAAAWSAALAGNDALARESIRRSAAVWKTTLIGPEASPTEQALGDAAVVARLALTHAESLAAAGDAARPVAEFAVKRLDAALRRFTSTLRLLAQVQAAGQNRPDTRSTPGAKMPRLYVPPVARGRKAG